MAFNAKESVALAKDYLKATPPFENIYLMPFNHGVEGQGLATIADYKDLFNFAIQKGEFIGTQQISTHLTLVFIFGMKKT